MRTAMLSIIEAAKLVGKSPRPIQIKAKKESWQGQSVPGVKWKRYRLSCYPESWQAIIRERLGLADEVVGDAHPTATRLYIDGGPTPSPSEGGELSIESSGAVPGAGALCDELDLSAPVSQPRPEPHPSPLLGRERGPEPTSLCGHPSEEGRGRQRHPGEWQLEHAHELECPDGTKAEVRAAARALLLQLVEPWCWREGIGRKLDCEQSFCDAYRSGRIAVPDWVRENCRKISRATLHNWRKLRQAPTGTSIIPLAGNFGRRTGGLIHNNEDIESHVFAILERLTIVSAGPTNVWRELKQILPEEICPSYAQILRYLQWLRTEKRNTYLMLCSPKDFRNKIAMAVGRLDQDCRPNDRWQLDFTRNDVLLEIGGKKARFALGMCIDVATKRRKVLLSPTPKGETTALLVAQCIKEWGLPVELRPDNGKEFINVRMRDLCNTLGIILNPCTPGEPQEKGNVEKALGDLSRRMQTLPNFVGHNVMQRQQIRESKGEQALIDAAMPEVELQAWLNKTIAEIHETPHQGRGMEGMSPNERLQMFVDQGWQAKPCPLDEVNLRRLTYSKEVTARRDYVLFDKRRYITEKLGQVSSGQKIRVASEGDICQVHVYSRDWSEYYGVAQWEITLTKGELAAVAQKAERVQKATLEGDKARAKEAKRAQKQMRSRPDQFTLPASELAVLQQIGEAGRGAELEVVAGETPTTQEQVGLPDNVVALTPGPSATTGRGEEEEPHRFQQTVRWWLWHWQRGDHDSDAEIRDEMALELTRANRGNILGQLKLGADEAYALGQQFGLEHRDCKALKEKVLARERADRLYAEQQQRRAN